MAKTVMVIAITLVILCLMINSARADRWASKDTACQAVSWAVISSKRI